MSDLRKAAEMALAKLDHLWEIAVDERMGTDVLPEIKALREALAQPEQEPVAYLDEGLGAFYWANDYKKNVGFTPLYAVPPHRWSNTTDEALMQEVRRRGFVICDAQIGREWVGLTDDDVHDAFNYVEMVKFLDFDRDRPEWCKAFARACEATLRHRNGEKQ